MSGEALYERYKDALKRGHVASLRGRVDEALAAYAEAARIAPERSTPHTSAGTALMRRKRPAEAVRHYEAALRIGPRDEAAMLGRAQALAALDRRPDAADAFDQLAEFQAAAGKLGDAVDAARRGLELAEGRERRRTLERLIERLRASEPGEPGRLALERALRVLEGTAMPSQHKARPAVPRGVAAAAAEQAAIAAAVEESMAGADVLGDALDGVEDEVAAVPDEVVEATAAVEDGVPAHAPVQTGPAAGQEPEPTTEPSAAAEAGTVPDAEPGRETGQPAEPDRESAPGAEAGLPAEETAAAEAEPEPEAEPEAEAEAEPEPAPPVILRVLDRDVPADVDLEDLARQAELHLDSGDPTAPERFLDLAAASLRVGRVDTALDACYQALALDPDDVGLHLALVQLYDRQGWTTLANDKLELLGRLAALGEDSATEERLAAARAARG
jgi:tetratricopeptide (TPR) repeat protein